VSDIDTAAVDSLKVLDPKRPIREVTLFGHQHGWVGSLFLGSCQPIFRLVAGRYDALLREAPGK
jgi:hypothetical protein